jgi:hypothetical protein
MKILLFLLSLFTATSVVADGGTTGVEAAIKHMITDGIAKYRVVPNRRHQLLKSESLLSELSAAICVASQKWNIPPMVLVAIAFRENSFRGAPVGKLGERSTFQIVPSMVKMIQSGLFPWSKIAEPACNLKTIDGAALCAAALLAIHRERCGSGAGALALYATGRTCKTDTERLKWLVGDRLGIAEYLSTRFGG